jgi:hypothetical protein
MRLPTAIVLMTFGVGTAAGDMKPLPPPSGKPVSDAIQRVIKDNAKGFRQCFQRELNRDPKVARGGKVVLAIDLDKTGTVKSVRVETTTLNNSNIESCLQREMLKLKFPPETAKFSFPFIFASA